MKTAIKVGVPFYADCRCNGLFAFARPLRKCQPSITLTHSCLLVLKATTVPLCDKKTTPEALEVRTQLPLYIDKWLHLHLRYLLRNQRCLCNRIKTFRLIAKRRINLRKSTLRAIGQPKVIVSWLKIDIYAYFQCPVKRNRDVPVPRSCAHCYRASLSETAVSANLDLILSWLSRSLSQRYEHFISLTTVIKSRINCMMTTDCQPAHSRMCFEQPLSQNGAPAWSGLSSANDSKRLDASCVAPSDTDTVLKTLQQLVTCFLQLRWISVQACLPKRTTPTLAVTTC